MKNVAKAVLRAVGANKILTALIAGLIAAVSTNALGYTPDARHVEAILTAAITVAIAAIESPM